MGSVREEDIKAVRSVRGGIIAEHRSLRRMPLSRSLPMVTLLPMMLTIVTWWARKHIVLAWTWVFSFWIGKLGLAGSASLPMVPEAGWFAFPLPQIDLAARPVDGRAWWATLLLTGFVLASSKLIPDKALPLRYFVRIVCFIQATALVFFAVAPMAFPYTLPEYMRSSTQAALWLLLFIPWVHALVFYIFDFSLMRKISLSLATMVFLVVAVPFQLMVHAYVIAKGSLLLMPLLYFMFGMPMLLFACVALYGWAMDWRQTRS